MDNSLLVRGFKRSRYLLRDGQGFIECNRALANSVRQGGTLDELHHQRADAVALFQSVDDGDIRVVQRRQGFGFSLEAG